MKLEVERLTRRWGFLAKSERLIEMNRDIHVSAPSETSQENHCIYYRFYLHEFTVTGFMVWWIKEGK